MHTILERYQKTFAKDREMAHAANQLFPDGVTHDGRHMSPFPIYITHAQGSKKWGLADKEFIDYWAGPRCLITRSQSTGNRRSGDNPDAPRDTLRRMPSAGIGMGFTRDTVDPVSRARPIR